MAYAFNDDKSKYDLEETIDNVNNLIGNMAVIETSPVIANHSAGEYIMYNGTLLEVLSPIATGENLVLGTNVTPINFGNEISRRVRKGDPLQAAYITQNTTVSGSSLFDIYVKRNDGHEYQLVLTTSNAILYDITNKKVVWTK